MESKHHWAVFTSNASNKSHFITQLFSGSPPAGFEILAGLRGALFSKREIDRYIEEEERHDRKIITQDTAQRLQTMSGGERKKALLHYILSLNPEFLVLDNPFDNLDTASQRDLRALFEKMAGHLPMVLIISRREDLLPFISRYCTLEGSEVQFPGELYAAGVPGPTGTPFKDEIPPPLDAVPYLEKELIRLEGISVSYGDKPVLDHIRWVIKPGEFWQLSGQNGSGKSTLLSMITGDNPKGYGQELYLFGNKKGSGESVWDIKRSIGYFTPVMTERFSGYHTLENMMISGLLDSIGLYIRPSEQQLRLAKQWLQLIGIWDRRNYYFHDLSTGDQRLLMCARAMVKHPYLLILDEPTAGLDDESASLVTALVNKMSLESDTAIIYVSHRDERDLRPDKTFLLQPGTKGSTGRIL